MTFFLSANMQAWVSTGSSATWAKFMVGKECAPSVSCGETVAYPVILFPGDFVYKEAPQKRSESAFSKGVARRSLRSFPRMTLASLMQPRASF